MSVSSAQLTYSWTNQVSGPSFQNGQSLALDASNNIIMGGSTFGNTVFSDVNNTQTVSGFGDYDFYVEKLDPGGQLIWSKHFGGPGLDILKSVATDPQGNIYLTGQFDQKILFEGGDSISTSADYSEIFLVKLNPNGQVLWAKQFGGKDNDEGTTLATDPAGNVYLSGFFKDSVDFNPGPDTFLLTNTSGSGAMFILKLNPDGNFVWAKHMQAGAPFGQSAGLSLYIKGNYLYTSGYFNGSVDFNPGPSVSLLTSQFDDGFLQKFSLQGNLVWIKQISGSGSERTLAITADAQDNVLCSGYFSSSVDLDPGAGTVTFNSAGNHDLFVLKLNASGNYVWGKKAGGSSQDQAWGITTDRQGNIYTTGKFGATVDFDPGPMAVNLASSGYSDAFILKLDPNGNFANVGKLGGPHFDYGNSILLDEDETIISAGDFSMTADFDPSTDSVFITAAGFDGFVNKLAQPWDYNGIVYHDLNENHLRDPGEPGLFGVLVEAVNRKAYASTNAQGEYHLYYNLAGDTMRVLPKRPYWVVTPPGMLMDTTQSGHQTGVIIPVKPDVCIFITQDRQFVPGFTRSMEIQVSNVGTVPVYNQPVVLEIVENPTGGPLQYLSATIPPLTHTDKTFNWVIDTLDIEQTVTIKVKFLIPAETTPGAAFSFSGMAQLDSDIYKANNVSRFSNNIRSSNDPNDKQVFPSQLTPAAADTTLLTYLIQFQNTGTFAATFIVLQDTLSEDLDLSTLQVLGASHPYTWRLYGKRVLEFRFDDINLPDSTSNEPESHGFAAFAIKPQKGLVAGDEVHNRVGIYFDFNQPVITNWATLQVKNLSGTVSPRDWLSFQLNPNPATAGERVLVQLPAGLKASAMLDVLDAQGKWVRQIQLPGETSQVYLEGLSAGQYFVRLSSGHQTGGQVLIVH